MSTLFDVLFICLERRKTINDYEMRPRKKRKEDSMKREDITGLFPEATQEQINKIMSINGSDINAAKKGLTDLQAEHQTAQETIKELQSQLEKSKERLEQFDAVQTELTELKQANEIRDMKAKVSKATGVPMDLLTGDTEEACKFQAESIKEFARPSTYPSIYDGGEPGGTSPKQTTREQFAEWFNSQH